MQLHARLSHDVSSVAHVQQGTVQQLGSGFHPVGCIAQGNAMTVTSSEVTPEARPKRCSSQSLAVEILDQSCKHVRDLCPSQSGAGVHLHGRGGRGRSRGQPVVRLQGPRHQLARRAAGTCCGGVPCGHCHRGTHPGAREGPLHCEKGVDFSLMKPIASNWRRCPGYKPQRLRRGVQGSNRINGSRQEHRSCISLYAHGHSICQAESL